MISQSVGRGVVQIEGGEFCTSSDAARHRSGSFRNNQAVGPSASHFGTVDVTMEVPPAGEHLPARFTSVGALMDMSMVV